MMSASSDTPVAKRPRKANTVATPRAMVRVFDVAMLLRGLLLLLDMPTICSLLEVLAADDSWRSVLRDANLWKELLDIHFKGDLPPMEPVEDADEPEETEEEDEQDEEEEQEEEEEESGDEPDLVEVLEANMDMDENDSMLGDEQDVEHATSDAELNIPRPRASHPLLRLQSGTESIAATTQVAAIKWTDAVPSRVVHNAACLPLKHFLRSAKQLRQFDTRVQIVRGDIGEIKTVGNQQVDGLAFPTAMDLHNPHTGAASVIFQRAGQELRNYVSTLNIRLDIGAAHATPAFSAGVDKLIHCVGPNRYNPHCMRDLQRTYRSVLRCVQAQQLHCVAMASISTGNMAIPVNEAAWFALCAIQRYMRSTDWTATIAIVCFDADVFAAFSTSKTKVMTLFNAEELRATPPVRIR